MRTVMTKISKRHVKKYAPDEYLSMLNPDYELGCKVCESTELSMTLLTLHRGA